MFYGQERYQKLSLCVSVTDTRTHFSPGYISLRSRLTRFLSCPFSRPRIDCYCLGETYLVCIEGRKRRVIKIAIGGMYIRVSGAEVSAWSVTHRVVTSVSIR